MNELRKIKLKTYLMIYQEETKKILKKINELISGGFLREQDTIKEIREILTEIINEEQKKE